MPSTVGTSTVNHPVSWPHQRKTFYANGRFWVVYHDGSNIVCKSSSDGTTWTQAFTITPNQSFDGRGFGVWFDGTYFHIAYPDETINYVVRYRRGLPNSDGTVTWSADTQVAQTSSDMLKAVNICVDSDGHAWVGYVNSSTRIPYVTKNANTDGTWSTASGFPYQLTTTENTYWQITPLPLTSGKVYVLYVSGPIYGKLWDGSSWSSEESSFTDEDAHDYFAFSAVAHGDTVHLVYSGETSVKIKYNRRDPSSGWLSSDEEVYDIGITTFAPSLSKTSDGTLYCIWMNQNDDCIYYKKRTGSGWDSSPTQLVCDTYSFQYSSQLTTFYKNYDSYIGIAYSTYNSDYLVRFTSFTITAYTLEGYTKDASGNPLSSCDVILFDSSDDSLINTTTSDANGYFEFTNLSSQGAFYLRAYKSGTPNVFGATTRDIYTNGSVNIYLYEGETTPEHIKLRVYPPTGETYTQTLETSLVLSDTRTLTPFENIYEIFSSLEVLDTLSNFQRAYLETLLSTETLVRKSTHEIVQSIQLQESRLQRSTKEFLESTTLTESSQKSLSKKIMEVFSSIENRLLSLIERLEEISSFTELFKRLVSKGFLEEFSLTDSLAKVWNSYRTLLEESSFLSKVSSRALKDITQSLYLTDVFSGVISIYRALIETLTFVEVSLRKFVKPFSETSAFSDLFSKVFSSTREFKETLSLILSLRLETFKRLFATLILSSVYSTFSSLYRAYQEIISLWELRSLSIRKLLLDTCSFSDKVKLIFSRLITHILNLYETSRKKLEVIRSQLFSLFDEITSSISGPLSQLLEELISLEDSLRKSPKVLKLENLNLVGQVLKKMILSLTNILDLESILKLVSSYLRSFQGFLNFADSLSSKATYLKIILVELVFSSQVSLFTSFSRLFSQVLNLGSLIKKEVSVLKEEIVSLQSKISSLFSRVILGSVSLTEVLFLKASYTRVYSEIVSLVDSVESIIGISRMLFETLTLVDTFSKIVSFSREFLENVSLSESLLKSLRAIKMATLNFVEKLVFLTHKYGTETFSLLSEILKAPILKLSEVSLLSSEISKIFQLFKLEALSLISRILKTSKTIILEGLSFFESLYSIIRKKLLQILNLVPSSSRIFQCIRIYLESLTLTETVSRVIGAIQTLYETLNLSSFISTSSSFFRFFTENLTLFSSLLKEIRTLRGQTILFISQVSSLISKRIFGLISLVEKVSYSTLVGLYKTLYEGINLLALFKFSLKRKVFSTLSLLEILEFKTIRINLEEIHFLGQEILRIFKGILEAFLISSLFGKKLKRTYLEALKLASKVSKILRRTLFEIRVFLDTLTKNLISLLSIIVQESLVLTTLTTKFFRKRVLNSLIAKGVTFKKSLVSWRETIRTISSLTISRILSKLLLGYLGLLESLSTRSVFKRLLISYLSLQETFLRKVSYLRTFIDSLNLGEIVKRARVVWIYIQSYARTLLKRYSVRALLKRNYVRTLLKRFEAKLREVFEKER